MSVRKVRFMVRQVEGVFANATVDVCRATNTSQIVPVYVEGLYQEFRTVEEARAVKRQNPKKLEIVRITTTTVS